MLHKEIGCDSGGYYCEVFDDSSEKIGRWYGSREDCETLNPRKVKLYPMRDSGIDPFDLACERRFD